jgi:hypothetical protein
MMIRFHHPRLLETKKGEEMQQYCLLLKAKKKKDILMVYSWYFLSHREAALAARERNQNLRREGLTRTFVTPFVLFERHMGYV